LLEKSENKSGRGISGVGVAVGSAGVAVAAAVSGAIVSTGKVLRGVGIVGVIVGVSVGIGVCVTVGVSVAVISASAVAVSNSGSSVSVGVLVKVALGVMYRWVSVAIIASVTRNTTARSAIAVSCCGVFAERVQASDGIRTSAINVLIIRIVDDGFFMQLFFSNQKTEEEYD
ncbi:MAG: hypothetical protein IJI45_17080, partial [Anaerolineaceae bacterium]|nr:hypothetical protein [Anaerolineaceae bacterium]